MKLRRLHSLEPHEVSVVARGAIGKKFLAFKSKGEPMSNRKAALQVAEQIKKGLPAKVAKRMQDTLKSLIAKRADGDGELTEEAQAALSAATRILAQFQDQITPADVQAMLAAGGLLPEDPAEAPAEEETDKTVAPTEEAPASEASPPSEQTPPEDADDETKKSEEDDEEEANKAKTESPAAPAAGGEGAAVKHDVGKSAKGAAETVSAEERQKMQSIFKAHQELVEKTKRLETELKVERDNRRTGEFIKKADSLRHLGVDRAKLGALMMAAHDADKSLGEELDNVLKSLDAQASVNPAGPFSELGSRLGNETGSSALQTAQAKIDSLVQKSANGKSRSQVASEFYSTPEGQKAYSDYIKEMGRA